MKMIIEQRQTLKMVMTTELRQAIELLQLSNYDLKKFIEKQAEENPFIELVERDFYHSYSHSKAFSSSTDGEEVDPLDFATNDERSLDEYLLEQVNLLSVDKRTRSILKFLVLNLNENGYLTMENSEISQFLNVSEEEVIDAREILKTLEPLGIGASDVKESLLIQAREKYKDDLLLFTTIENHLEDLANRRWKVIAERLHISRKQVAELLKKVQTLQPKPAMNFSTKGISYVSPDIFVEWDDKKQSFEVALNNYYIPDIQFNNDYAHFLKQTDEIASYVNEQFKKYNWLQQSIEQRRRTIMKIMEVVLRRQRDFFIEGFRALKPLTLKDVANEIEMHESTVSRATANKIVQTPNGTFELRRLFSTSVTTKEGNDASQTKVKQLLKEIIDEENKQKPLSDQKIANLLKEEHQVVISRRTVAKYRDEMNIPSSTKRKEMFH